LRQRSFETAAGEKRTVVELEVDEVGPSLRYAKATVVKAARNGSAPAPAASSRSTLRAPAGRASAPTDDEPPF
jgi:single-strand DNA-binding protein